VEMSTKFRGERERVLEAGEGGTTEKKDDGRKIEATTTANGFLWA